MALLLKIIFEVALNDGVSPGDWRKVNIAPVHKKDLKTILINYHPVSLLPIIFLTAGYPTARLGALSRDSLTHRCYSLHFNDFDPKDT